MGERIQNLPHALDRYFRSNNTVLAHITHAVCPHKGSKYIDSASKRVLDCSLSVPAAFIVAPFILALGVAKKLEDGGSAFFVQKRLKPNMQETVGIIKIRSMREGSDNGISNIEMYKGKKAWEDSRNTPLGAFMRRFQLEELPQLFQVIKGELSITGVRPAPQYVFDYLEKHWSSLRMRRYAAVYQKGKLGLTGPNQVFGTETKVDETRFHYDVFGIDNASLGLDLYLIWRTIAKLTKFI